MNEVLSKLTDAGILSFLSARLAEDYAAKWDKTLVHSILDCHLLTESELADGIGKVFELKRIHNLNSDMVDGESLKKIKLQTALSLECVPIVQRKQNTLTIAVCDPFRADLAPTLDQLFASDCYQYLVGDRSHIVKTILDAYPITIGIPGISLKEN